ncbi:UDP-N-acetylmuramoyl-L-alanyl-D-glutamate--2,6-diaminopimelate ligase [Kiritimatiellota bacterium B12222]|nr:UDP-N-acetylmuramoyl-L-alanyl-D-glutamate--2,6-diaminopimelate ligase [Kiritimatiellota bacterium B12222]
MTIQTWTDCLGVPPPAHWVERLQGVHPDSRRIRAGDIFVAIEGHEGDGHRFVTDAIRRGAVAVIVEQPLSLSVKVPVVQVPDSRKALTALAGCLYGSPDTPLRLTGVTGTNGKTSVVGFVRQFLELQGQACGELGTVSYRFGQREIPARRTTPGAPELQEYLRSMVDAGCKNCVMEVSSHALDQQRVAGMAFDTAVFTNLSQDHLDYHQDMESYFQAKAGFFAFPSLTHRIVGDDRWSRRLAEQFGSDVIRCGLDEDCEVRGRILSSSLDGSQAFVDSPWGSGDLFIQQPGEHNLRNILQAMAVVAAGGMPFEDILQTAGRLQAAPGRLQEVASGCGKVLVDYAHTPDALRNVLGLLKPLTRGKVIVVFGCGGDRDRTKRPLMVQAASQADEIILTTDNPRTEDPAQIFADMQTGLGEGDCVQVIADRRLAIQAGVEKLQADDLLLIAGKGHETVQWVGALQLPFDDRSVAVECLTQRELSKTGGC